MALATKVFSGSLSSNAGTTTLYVVPAGRVAKVEFSYVFIQESSGNSFSLIIGGIGTISGSVAGTGFSTLISTNPNNTNLPPLSCGKDQKIGITNSTPAIFTTVYYLPAGASILVSGTSNGTGFINYQFVAVEETAG